MAEEQFGYRREELFGQPVEMLVADEQRDGHYKMRAAFIASPDVRKMGQGRELYGRRKDGTKMPVEVGLAPIKRARGPSGALATVIDVSERRAADLRQQILVNEIKHRSRNILARVQAIAAQMLPTELRREFSSAINNLARARNLLGETGNAPLAQIIGMELASFRGQISVSGCDVLLLPRTAEDFALIVHELTTNSIKHGALSAPQGRVDITGSEEDGRFTFLWRESGGPPVAAPKRSGYGQVILQDVPKTFCEHVAADYAESGFRYELRAGLGKISSVVIEFAERRESGAG